MQSAAVVGAEADGVGCPKAAGAGIQQAITVANAMTIRDTAAAQEFV
ncbi:MAG: hypothetical protein E7E73_07620 [Negativicoccus succinicivorans]|nr:hypothetical protein [Negativicoccus succinicivorans]